MKKYFTNLADYLLVLCSIITALSAYILGEKLAILIFDMQETSSIDTVRISTVF